MFKSEGMLTKVVLLSNSKVVLTPASAVGVLSTV